MELSSSDHRRFSPTWFLHSGLEYFQVYSWLCCFGGNV